MYKKGYTIQTQSGQELTLFKSDFAGDRSFTHTAFQKMLEAIRNIAAEDYPIRIIDRDIENAKTTLVESPSALEEWLEADIE